MKKMNIQVNTNMSLKFIIHKMWHPTEATIEQDELLSFPHMAEALDSAHKTLVYVKPKLLKSC